MCTCAYECAFELHLCIGMIVGELLKLTQSLHTCLCYMYPWKLEKQTVRVLAFLLNGFKQTLHYLQGNTWFFFTLTIFWWYNIYLDKYSPKQVYLALPSVTDSFENLPVLITRQNSKEQWLLCRWHFHLLIGEPFFM